MSKVLEHYTVPTADGVKRMRYVSRVDFRNLGLSFGGFHTFAVLTPWGNLLACKWDKRLFSYRYGYRDCVRVLGLCVYWVRLKRAEGDPLDTGNELSEKPTMPKLQTTKTRPRQWLEAKRFHSDDACLIYPFALLTGIAASSEKSLTEIGSGAKRWPPDSPSKPAPANAGAALFLAPKTNHSDQALEQSHPKQANP